MTAPAPKFPAPLVARDQWVAFRLEPKPGDPGKFIKVPYVGPHQRFTGRTLTFADAAALAASDGFAGVGFRLVLPGRPVALKDYAAELSALKAEHRIGEGAPANAPLDDAALRDRLPPLNVDLADTDLLRLMAQEHPDAFSRHFEERGGEGEDASREDGRLVGFVVRYVGWDEDRIERVCRLSERERDKWAAERRHRFTRERTTWIGFTIRNLLRAAAAKAGGPAASLDLRTGAELDTPENRAPAAAVAWGLAYRRRVVLFPAREKLGKSTYLTALVAAVTTGRPWLGRRTEQGDVLWVSADREPDGDVLARLVRFGANLQRFHRLRPRTAAELYAALDRLPGVVLVVVDTLSSFAKGLVERATQSDDWPGVLLPLAEAAQARDLAVVIAAHAAASAEASATKAYRDSTQIGANVDGIAGMRRNADTPRRRDFETVFRFACDVPEKYGAILEEGGYRYIGPTPPAAERAERPVLLWLRDHPAENNQDAVAEGVRIHKQTVVDTLGALIDKGHVTDERTGERAAHKYAIAAAGRERLARPDF